MAMVMDTAMATVMVMDTAILTVTKKNHGISEFSARKKNIIISILIHQIRRLNN